VFGNAQVFGDAEVFGDAQVFGDAEVYGNARVFGNAWVFGDAEVYGNARVYGDARVSGDARVFGNAEVFGDENCKKSPIVITGPFYTVIVGDKYVSIGCKQYTAKKWRAFTREQIENMGGNWNDFEKLIKVLGALGL